MDNADFEQELKAALPRVRGVVRRMLGNPDDTDDVVQECMLKAFEKRESFRAEAAFSTWLVTIATRLALNHLRSSSRWRWDSQVHAARTLHGSPESRKQTYELVASPTAKFEAREHIAFCFACVGRSLPPEQQAAIVLRDVYGYSNREAAKINEVTESVFRHTLSDGRQEMQKRFDGLCGLISKQGVCHQCEGLRDKAPSNAKGPAIPSLAIADAPKDQLYQLRVRSIRKANIDNGLMQPFHDFVSRHISRHEPNGASD